MIDVTKLSFSYGKREVLRDLSFSIARGTVNFVLGANGAGKTTLFRCLLGLLPGYDGSILVEGRDIRKLSPPQMASMIAYIPQAHANVFAYTALDIALMGLGGKLSPFAAPGRKQREIAMNALETVGVAELADRSIQQLSGGERQLILIARALAQQADILMMDEPTSSLDYGNQLRVLEGVCKLANDGHTIVISSHNPQHAYLFANRIIALKDGQIAADGEVGEVMDEKLIFGLYGVRVRFISDERGIAILPQLDNQ